jgi:hypothetical protein
VILVVAFLAVRGYTTQRRDAALAAFDFPEYARQAEESRGSVAESTEEEVIHDPSYPSYYQVLYETQLMVPNRWSDLMWKREHPKDRGDDYWGSVDEHLRPVRRSLARLRKRAALGGPIVTLELPNNYSGDLRHVSRASIAAEALAVEADWAVHEGDVDLAVANVVAMIQLASALASEPIFYSQHARLTISRLAFDAIEHTLPAPLEPVHARQVLDVLGDADYRDALADSFASQVLLAQSYIREPEKLVEQRDDWAEYLAVNDPVFLLYNTPLGAPLRDMDESTFVEMSGRLRDAARMPYHEAVQQIAAIEREIEDLPPTRRFTQGNLQPGSGWCRMQGEHEARIDLIQLGLAVEQYHAEHGDYPSSLDAIADAFPEGLPVDPLTGQQYVYLPMESTFRLYSIGTDGVDDGGTMHRRGEQGTIQGDIVWRGVVEER